MWIPKFVYFFGLIGRQQGQTQSHLHSTIHYLTTLLTGAHDAIATFFDVVAPHSQSGVE